MPRLRETVPPAGLRNIAAGGRGRVTLPSSRSVRAAVLLDEVLGRAAYLRTDRLREFWIQVNDFCNLACAQCLGSSGPDRAQGLPGDAVRARTQGRGARSCRHRCRRRSTAADAC